MAEKETLTLGDRAARPAAARDTEVRASVKKTRRKKTDEVDEFYVDPADVPDGFTVEWKRYSTMGKVDAQHHVGLEKDGWEYAQPKDFPSVVGRNHKDATIVIKDLVLMIRPKELTAEARAEERQKSQNQVRSKLEEIGLSKPGELQRTDSAGRNLAKVKTSYERIPVSD